MTEQATIDAQALPATVASIASDLRALGVEPGMTLLVHSSLSALGWVAGGPQAVILALEDAVAPGGTIVMPSHSSHLTDPAPWQAPPVPPTWWPIIRAETPAYDPDLTPTRGMGVIAETFRKQRGARRSAHPHTSFAAWGEHAAQITDGHPLPFGMGDDSPLAQVYDLDGWVLLLGVGHGNNSSLHLAEYRVALPDPPSVTAAAPVLQYGERRWAEFPDLDWDDGDFVELGGAFGRDTDHVRSGSVAAAPSLLMPQRALVDYGVEWMAEHRS